MSMIEGELIVNPAEAFERETKTAVIGQLVKRAETKLNIGRAALSPRQILPQTDINQTREVWEKDLSAGTINDYNAYVSDYSLSDQRVLGVWGVYKAEKGDDIVTIVRFRQSTESVINYWQIEDMEVGDKAIITKPQDAILYDPKGKVDIYYYIEAQGKSRIKLLGATVEKKQKVMGPKAWI